MSTKANSAGPIVQRRSFCFKGKADGQQAAPRPWWIMGGGLGMTGLMAAMLYLQVRTREAPQSVLDALREANERLLVAYSRAGIALSRFA